MIKVAVGIGGNFGRGAMVCRTGKMFDGAWGAPAMYTIEGGSFGLQLGAESTDLVLLVMNPSGVNALLSRKVKLGGNASAAAGPKGRTMEASTDASMRSEILSYSRSRGLFAGVSLSGSSLRPDNDASAEVYGRKTRRGASSRGRPRRSPSRAITSSTCCRRTLRATCLAWRRPDNGERTVGVAPVRTGDGPSHVRVAHVRDLES